MGINLEKIGDPGEEIPRDFPPLHDANIDRLKISIDGTGVSVANIESDVNQNASDINVLQTEILNISGQDIQQLSSDVEALNQKTTIHDAQILAISASSPDLSALEQDVAPLDNETHTLGASGFAWDRLYVSEGGIYLGDKRLEYSNNRLVIDDAVLAYDDELGSLQAQINALGGISGTSAFVIGDAEDGSYSDGLFPFSPTTPIGHAVDAMNEVLAIFSPPLPGNLTSIDITQGETGKLSFGGSNSIGTYFTVGGLDINDIFGDNNSLGDIPREAGIFDSTAIVTGTLADNQAGHAYAYTTNSFSDGDKGVLELLVNNTVVHSVDLTTFGSGLTETVGSGFTLSLATPLEFEGGEPLPQFKYRTGTWHAVLPRNGSNDITVRHVVDANTHNTITFKAVKDADVNDANLDIHLIDNLQLSPNVFLSGVKYSTSATAKLNIVVGNAYNNTYSTANITHPVTTRCSVSSISIPPMVTELDIIDISGANSQAITVDSSARILNQGISINTSVPKTLGRGFISATINQYNLLIDPFTNDSASSTDENFNGENFRLSTEVYDISGNMLQTTGYNALGTSPFKWDSQKKIVPSELYYDTGLLQFNGRLYYPNNPVLPFNGNFTQVVNGPTANRNYTFASGNREYLRYFYFDPAVGHTDFLVDINCVNTVFTEVVNGVAGNNLTIELLAPSETKNGTDDVEFKDAFAENFTLNFSEVGMFAETIFPSYDRAGNNPTWGIGLYQKNTVNSGGVLILRITASSNWSGYIDNISITAIN